MRAILLPIILFLANVCFAADGIRPSTDFALPLTIDGKDVQGKAIVQGEELRVTDPKPMRYQIRKVEEGPTPDGGLKYVIAVGKASERSPERALLLFNTSLRELVGVGNFWPISLDQSSEPAFTPWIDKAIADAKLVGKDPATTPWWLLVNADWQIIASELVPTGHDAVEARLRSLIKDVGPPPGKQLGCQPRTTKVGAGRFKTFADSWVIPKKEWKPVSMRSLVPAILDQNGTNECCPHGGIGALHLVRAVEGAPYVELSPASVYRFGNGGVDQGMDLETCLDILRDRGALPVTMYPSRNWRAPYPKGGDTVARGFRALDWRDCPTTAHIGSAVQRGWPVLIGVRWSGGGGHAILVVGWRSESPEWQIQNSWGDWGDNGFGHLPESQVSRGIQIYGAWALCVVTRPSTDPMPLPPAPPRVKKKPKGTPLAIAG